MVQHVFRAAAGTRRRLLTVLAIGVVLGCGRSGPGPTSSGENVFPDDSPVETPPIHRFLEEIDKNDPWYEQKMTLGVETRDVLFAPRLSDLRQIEVPPDGAISLADVDAGGVVTPRGLPIAIGYKLSWTPAELPFPNGGFESNDPENRPIGWNVEGRVASAAAEGIAAGKNALLLLGPGTTLRHTVSETTGSLRAKVLVVRVAAKAGAPNQLRLEVRYRTAETETPASHVATHPGGGEWREVIVSENLPRSLVPNSLEIIVTRGTGGPASDVLIDDVKIYAASPDEIDAWKSAPPNFAAVIAPPASAKLPPAKIRVPILPAAETPRAAHAQYIEMLPAELRLRTQPVLVPQGSKLVFGYGLVLPPPAEDVYPVRFEIFAVASTGTTLIFETMMPMHSKYRGRWIDTSVDLSAFAGQEIAFEFKSEIVLDSPNAPRSPYLTPLWSNPYLASPTSKHRPEGPNFLLISLDTMSARHMGLYGYSRATTPRLESLAPRFFVFDNAFAPASWTLPSHTSIFTGLAAAVHGAGVNRRGYKVKPEWTTLAEVMRRNGYLTTAFTEGVAVRGDLGFHQGFEQYSNGTNRPLPQGLITTTFGLAENWLEAHADLPFFAFVHTYEAHWPYIPPDDFRAKFTDAPYVPSPTPFQEERLTPLDKQRFIDHYDAEIAYTDSVVGSFLERIADKGLLDNTVVILFSDHGEELWEHGAYGHLNNNQIYDEVLHVPLMIRLPGPDATGGRVQQVVCTTDIFNTVLDLAKLNVDGVRDSQSLVPLMRSDGGEYGREFVVSQLVMHDKEAARGQPQPPDWTTRSVRTLDEKYIRSNRDHVRAAANAGPEQAQLSQQQFDEELYDLKTDYGEKTNLGAERPERAEHFRSILAAFLAAMGAPADDAIGGPSQPVQLDQTLREQLEAMGYL
ncbi:MAG: sulfatase [Candidatus Hydrogenedentota bacterium]